VAANCERSQVQEEDAFFPGKKMSSSSCSHGFESCGELCSILLLIKTALR
jgi:hypothetical protein